MKQFLLIVAAGWSLTGHALFADDAVVPAANFQASRYESLWTKSPFAVETSETAVEESPDYLLVGFANIDGVSYASVIERQSPQEHFLISSDKPVKGLTLTSITIGKNGSDTYAVVNRNGQPITLKLEQAPAGAGAQPNAPVGAVPGSLTPQIPMPGALNGGPSVRGLIPARFHHQPIHLPPRPDQEHPPLPPGAGP
jgi:hypothetical protein